jgi:SAM-dependent methyltransferase
LRKDEDLHFVFSILDSRFLIDERRTMHPDSLTHKLFQTLAPGSLVLDLGCGTGRHAQALARAGFRVAGLDLDVDALETARFLQAAEARAALFAAGDARALPFKDGAFDAVLCVDVLHWSESAEAFDAAWAEARRVLRPRGLWAARLRLREENPDAQAVGGGRYRLASGAEWFLADRAALEARAAAGAKGEWVEAPVADGEGAARFVLRRR